MQCGVDGLGADEPQLAGHRERRQLCPVTDLVGQHAPKCRHMMLVAQPAVQAHVLRGPHRQQIVDAHRERVGSEPIQRWAVVVARRHAPHTGLAFGPRFGEEQRRSVVEYETSASVARLGRLLLVDKQPPALHEVHRETNAGELQQQILAAPLDSAQRLAVCLVGPRRGRLQHGEVERHEASQHPSRELRVEAFDVGLHLGKLGHAVSGTR
jgi:hypothetical protein